MAISFAIVLAVMALLGALKPLSTPVVIQTNTTINLESSLGVRICGVVVVVVTLLLYIIFW